MPGGGCASALPGRAFILSHPRHIAQPWACHQRAGPWETLKEHLENCQGAITFLCP